MKIPVGLVSAEEKVAVDEFYPPSIGEITKILRKHPLIKFRNEVLRAFLVGSFAKGYPNNDSDVDILLEIVPEPGMTAQEVTEFNRRGLQEFFMKNRIPGTMDEVHPQWCGRRVDIYITYDASAEARPKFELPITPKTISSNALTVYRNSMATIAAAEGKLDEWEIKCLPKSALKP